MHLSLAEVLERAETKTERLILAVLYQYKTATEHRLMETTGEGLLALLPILQRMREKGLIGLVEASSQNRYKLTI